MASALSAAGVSIFSRGFKYHRPRGLLCAAGRCPNCLVTVDDVPNVRACTEQVRPGMKVSHQNAWPSLQRDFLSILDYFHWLMPVGFYYKALHRPKWLWQFSQKIIRRIAGLGKIDIDAVPEDPLPPSEPPRRRGGHRRRPRRNVRCSGGQRAGHAGGPGRRSTVPRRELALRPTPILQHSWVWEWDRRRNRTRTSRQGIGGQKYRGSVRGKCFRPVPGPASGNSSGRPPHQAPGGPGCHSYRVL